jgi:hypothetical protein
MNNLIEEALTGLEMAQGPDPAQAVEAVPEAGDQGFGQGLD